MNLQKYQYLWQDKENKNVLLKTDFGYSIIDRINKTMLLIEDNELEAEILAKMIQHNVPIFESIDNLF